MSSYFKPVQSSQYAPRYAPIPLDAVRFGVQQANQTRTQAQTMLDQAMAQEADIRSSMSPANLKAAEEVLEQNRSFLDRLADPEADVRYADMIPLLRKQVRQSTRKLQPYLEDSERIRQYREELKEGYDAGRISNAQRSRALGAVGNYGGLQFDEDGSPVGFQGPTWVNDVDIQGQASEIAQALRQGDTRMLVEQFPDDPAFVRKVTREGIRDPETAAAMIAQQLLTNPDNRAFLNAEFDAVNYLKEQSGEEPLEWSEFLGQTVSPATSEAFREKSDIMRNPRFSVTDSGLEGFGSSRTRTLTIGTKPQEFGSFGELNTFITEQRDFIENLPSQIMQAELTPEVQERTRVNEEGMLEIIDPIIDGVDRSEEIRRANEMIEQNRERFEYFNNLESSLREKAGIDEDLGQEHKLMQRAFRSWADDNLQSRGISLGQGLEGRGMPQAAKEILRNSQTWEEFQQSEAYDEALLTMGENAEPYRRLMDMMEQVTGQGSFDVTVPSSLPDKTEKQLIKELKLHGRRSVLYDATTREAIPGEDADSEARKLIDNAEEIHAYGYVRDPNTNESFIAYTLNMGDEGSREVLLPADNVGGLAALYNSGRYDNTVQGDISRRIDQLSVNPGGVGSFEYSVTPDVEPLKVRILPLSDQGANRRFALQIPDSEGKYAEKVYKDEPALLDAILQYMVNYDELNNPDE